MPGRQEQEIVREEKGAYALRTARQGALVANDLVGKHSRFWMS